MAYTADSFLKKIKPMVIKDMRDNKILASLTAAQALIESNKGNSGLAVKGNNLFGIKGTYNGQSVKMQTTEYYDGQPIKVMADFRKYPSWQESISDHSGLFNRMKRYENLRGLKDYKLACKYVKDDGYATSPTYTQTLLNTIEKYKLYEWDREAESAEPTPTINYDPAIRPTLRKGDRNDYVKAWQTLLNLNGYDCGNVDGIFGDKTEKAVLKWQQDHGMEAGYIGNQTWNTVP